MMVRIFLILSMLCAGGSLYLSHDKVQARKNKVEDDRAKAESARDKAIQDRKAKEGEEAAKLGEHDSVSNQWYSVTLQITNKVEQVAEIIHLSVISRRLMHIHTPRHQRDHSGCISGGDMFSGF